MTRLLVFGEFYEEFILSEQEILGFADKVSYHNSCELRSTLYHYYKILKDNQEKDASLKIWIVSFINL